MITPTMDHPMSMQPTNIVGPLTQQMNHLSLGTAGTVSGRVCFCVLGLEKVPRAVFTSIANKLLISHPLRVPARVSLHASSIPGNTHSHGKGGGAVAWPLDFRSPSLCDARLQARQSAPCETQLFLERCPSAYRCPSIPHDHMHGAAFLSPAAYQPNPLSFPGSSHLRGQF